ncbi:anti-sigma factor domain-containing protein [Marinobacter sp.]|uniref:anti-sigma factor n=1 Tax=Marinobacter sp. TaxID=50741 RepID=UPI0035C71D0B
MTERDDLDMLVAEFVLGTLPANERDDLEKRRQTDTELDNLILQWQERLGSLAEETPEVQPSPELFPRIEKALDQLGADQPAAANSAKTTVQSPGESNVVTLRRQLRNWRLSTALASAAALVLVAVLVFQPAPTPSQQSFVAVFQHNDEQPAFLLSVDLQNRRLDIRPITAEPREDKSYQLWIKDDELGPNPRSVGVLGNGFTLSDDALKDYDPALLKRATFGISLEPPGGSPTGQPTGPAIHGYLYPAGTGAGNATP